MTADQRKRVMTEQYSDENGRIAPLTGNFADQSNNEIKKVASLNGCFWTDTH
jgi:hypothetical protein